MSSPADNPYASPAEAEIAYSPFPPGESAKEVFVAWEKLRIIYNSVLAVISLTAAHAWLAFLSIEDLLGLLFQGAIGANVCFCLGPVIEGYLSLIGINRGKARIGLFVLGTMIASLLAISVLARWSHKI